VIRHSPFPADIIDSWPEVLCDIKVKFIPLHYVTTFKVIFKDDRIWEVNIDRRNQYDMHRLEQVLSEYIDTNNDVIEYIDFQLDIKRLKRDIIKKTKTFLKTFK
jgi:hypothetical protein